MPETMEQDALAILEDKILRALETVTRLREERDEARAAVSELDPLKARVAALTREAESARGERDALRADKDRVRQRIEKLLAQIDTLGQG